MKCVSKVVSWCAGAFLAGNVLAGTSYTWTGAVDGHWTNAANWVITGTETVPDACPGVVEEAYAESDYKNPLFVAAAGSDSLALFTGAETGAKATTIDLEGLFCVSNVTVSGASAAAYTFGTSASQVLRFPIGLCNGTTGGGSTGFFVTSDVPTAPILTATVSVYLWYYGPAGSRVMPKAWSHLGFVISNAGAQQLKIGKIGLPVVGYDLNATTVFESIVSLQGGSSGGGVCLTDSASAPAGTNVQYLLFLGQGTPLEIKGSVGGFAKLFSGSSAGKCVMTIPSGSVFKIAKALSGSTHGVTVTLGIFETQGEGLFAFYSAGTQSAEVCVYPSERQAVFNSRVTVWGDDETENGRGILATGTSGKDSYASSCEGGGQIHFNGINEMTGPFAFAGTSSAYYGNRAYFKTIGAPAEPSAAGIATNLTMTSHGMIAYSGTGETSTKGLVISKGNLIENKAVVGECNEAVLGHYGSGAWTYAGVISQDVANATLFLRNSSSPTTVATLSSALNQTTWNDAAATLNVVVMGGREWKMTAANTYTGTTTVQYANTLSLEGAGSIAESSEVILQGAALRVCAGAGAKTIRKITLQSNATYPDYKNVLDVGDGASLTVTQFVRESGLLNIVRAGDGMVCIPDLAGQDVSAWLTLNGATVRVSSEGHLLKALPCAVDAEISAKGSEVPNDAAQNVAITTAGSGADTKLAAAETAVKTLLHVYSGAATVAIGTDEKLVAEKVYVADGAGTLAIGDTAGQGTFAPSSADAFGNDSKAQDAQITVNATYDRADLRVTATSGAVTLAGGTKACVAPQVEGGTLTLSGTKTFWLTGGSIGSNKWGAAASGLKLTDAKDVRFDSPTNFLKVGARAITAFDSTLDNAITGKLTIVNSTWTSVSNVFAHGTTLIPRTEDSLAFVNGAILVGANARGIVEIGEGACVSNRFILGGCDTEWPKCDRHNNGIGAVYQRGGEMYLHGADTDFERQYGSSIGSSLGLGYYELTGGKMACALGLVLRAYGSFRMSGTTTLKTCQGGTKGKTTAVGDSSGSCCEMRLSDSARMDAPGPLFLNRSWGSANRSYTTIEDEAVLALESQYDIQFNTGVTKGAGPHRSQLTLNGNGRVEARYMYQGLGSGGRHGDEQGSDYRAMLAFNGGTFKAIGVGAWLFTCNQNGKKNATFALDDVWVFAGGATIDSAYDNEVHVPIKGVAGNGVTGVLDFEPICDIAPYLAVITGGGGEGAVATVEFDSTKGKMTGVRILCPGVGYTTAPTLTLYCGSTAYKTYTCTIGANVETGAFTKDGAGTLTLYATNTYGGATILKGGTLTCGVDAALPADSTFVLAGGKLDMNGKTLSDDATTCPTKWAVDALNGEVSYPGDLAFPAAATLTILNADEIIANDRHCTLLTVTGTASGAPTILGLDDPRFVPAWYGGTLRVKRLRGTVITVR